MSGDQEALEEEEVEAEEPDEEEESTPTALLFGVYDVSDMQFADQSTKRYITVTPVAHTLGRHASKQFQKSEISIVERLINRLMRSGENSGQKHRSMGIVKDAFEIVESRTEDNPIQVLVHAIENSGPREETVRLKYGGISVPKAVDVSPQRRVDQALKFLAEGTHSGSHKSTTSAAEALANQILGAADYNLQTYAISQKEELERVAAAAR